MRSILVAAALVAPLITAVPAHADDVLRTFTTTGESTFVVPAGVTSVDVRAAGGHGAQGATGAVGGRGGLVVGRLPTTPGTTLTIRVGMGPGTRGSAVNYSGGAGGGLAAVTYASVSRIVAAGGGGGAGGPSAGVGGDAESAGQDGVAVGSNAAGGAAGTQAGPGLGGAGVGGGNAGQAGVILGLGGAAPLAFGGAGGSAAGVALSTAGGGGGAGLYGGGGGGSTGSSTGRGAGGGAGGSNYVDPTVTSVAKGLSSDTAASVRLVYTDPVPPTIKLDPVGTNPTTVTGIAGVDTGDADEVTIGFTVPGVAQSLVSTGVASDGTFSATVPDLADGTWIAEAVQSDAAGNSGITAPRSFKVARVAAVSAFTGPGDSASSAVAIGGQAGTAGVLTLSLERDGAPLRAIVANVGVGAFTVPVTGLADGVYTVRAGALSRTFRVDTVAPEIETTAFHAYYALGEATSPLANCSDAGSGIAACDGPTALDTEVAGEHAVTITALDRVGNTRTVSLRYVVIAPVLAAPAPAPTATPAPTPPAAPAKAVAALKITSGKVKAGKLTVRGTVARTATGKVTVKVGATKKVVTVKNGIWSVTLKASKTKKVTISVSYAGNAAVLPGTAKKTLSLA